MRQLKHDMRYEHAKTFPSKVKADENRWLIRASHLTIPGQNKTKRERCIKGGNGPLSYKHLKLRILFRLYYPDRNTPGYKKKILKTENYM